MAGWVTATKVQFDAEMILARWEAGEWIGHGELELLARRQAVRPGYS